jgi:protein required for attachment to host cells
MKPVRTLVLVAGEEDARFFENAGVGHGLTEVSILSIDAFPDARTEYADRPGRAAISHGSGAMQAFDRRQSEDEQRRERFARHVAEAIGRTWTSGRYDRFVVAAPPKMLGELRKDMPRPAAAALAAELPKDLVKVPVHGLARHFEDVIVF